MAVIVDPILRGSRATVTAAIIRCLSDESNELQLVTRRQFLTEHVEQLFDWTSISLYSVVPVSRRVWYQRISAHIQLFQAAVVLSMLRRSESDTCVFTGMNENAITVAVVAGIARLFCRDCVIVAIDHMPQYLIGRSLSLNWRRRLKQLLIGPLCALNPRLILTYADERVFDPGMEPTLRRSNIAALPDPAPDRSEFPIRSGSRSNSVLLVGNQSSRKGLRSVLDLLKWCSQNDRRVTWHTRLVGQLTLETEPLRQTLVQFEKEGLLSWRESYISELDLRREISESGYVWLPYEKSFESSSGVFAYAMAAGTPVLSTDHGAIGYRVARFGVGFSYPAESAVEAYQSVKEATTCSSNAYAHMQENANRLYLSYSEEHFCFKLRELIRSRVIAG